MTAKGRTVLHGVQQSYPSFASRPTSVNMASRSYQEDALTEMQYDDSLGQWVVPHGVISGYHNFAVHGGLVGAGGIDLGTEIPKGFIIINAVIDVITTYTSPTTDAATIALQVEAANDIVAAVAISDESNPWDAGLKQAKPDHATLGDKVKATVARKLKMIVGVESITAGKMRIFLEGFQSTVT
jgi:hypothetical protein